MVCSHLEYAQTVWSPHKQLNIELLEKVQRQATKTVPVLYKLPYEQTTEAYEVKSANINFRRARGDMIETFKILNGFYDDSACPTLHRAVYENTRGHCMNLFKMHARKDARKYNFSVRVVDVWNSLPE